MSVNFPGGTFAFQKITPSEDAAVRRAFLGDGTLAGCKLSYSGATLTMGAGLLFLCGRIVRHPLEQHWSITGATSGYARLVITQDLSRTATIEEFDQVGDTIEYADRIDGFAPLVQEDINAGGTIYQAVVCTVTLNAGSITNIVNGVPLLNGSQFYAPSGYGLGVTTPYAIPTLSNLDYLYRCGWYQLNIMYGPADISGVNVSRATVFMEAYDELNAVQTISAITQKDGVCRIVRSKVNGTWNPWCFENPPLALGTEYRTTEYWGALPVYIQRIAYYPDAFTSENLSLPHNIENMDVCISADVLWKRTDRTPDGWRHLPATFHADSSFSGQVDYVDEENIKFRLGWSLLEMIQKSDKYVYVTLKYTKK